MKSLQPMKSLANLTFAIALFPATLLVSQSASAREEMREGRTYLGVMGTRVNHRSVDETLNGQGWSSAAALLIGTHVSEYFHAELRLGTGVTPGTVDQQLEVDLDYFASWYFGGHYPITSYSNAYAQFGFTHVKGDAKLTDGQRGQNYQDIADNKYPGSSFSVSWLLGLDFEVIDNGFVFLEGGKLFEDTETNANVFQYSVGAKYEF
ncbi:outer membrane beta-barrel protein [Marinobacter confluentis]|uniref:Porin family protein n=1 Tax=Marinobacter confluentis TaxID=1697557 RepID=A0A4Z1C3S3_9GAMM|nr:outer membrane beta-barrel protein [Marinobacter confluentis]TGN41888.1 porin family protein [Marinobacter confluentis]